MLDVKALEVFYGASRALRGVDFSAKGGEVACVLGRNGVGKTTLARAIVGHARAATGSISLGGVDVTRAPAHRRARAGVAYVPQGREIFPLLTVKENLETGFATRPRKDRALEPELFDLFPALADMMGRRGGDLSGGQQQQLAIARALVTRPRLLVLDEPTEGIQPSIIKDIGRAIAHLRRRGGMAIVLIEQYVDFARDLADSFVVLDRGAVALAGDRAAMDEGEIRRLVAV